MTRHFRWVAISSVILGSSIYSYSEKVSINEAQSLATEFVKARSGYRSADVKLIPVYTGGSEKNPLYYVFDVADNGGFVMVSAEDATTPILGYSYEGNYPVKNMPDGMKWMLDGLENEIKVAPTVQKSIPTAELRKSARKAGEKAAQKLLETPSWSQEGPFNAMIPGKPLVGCVGTAMATIMKYYEHPVAGTGSFGGVDFATAYDWANMRMDNYRSGYNDAESEAVATLMYHASKSIDTLYAMSGSSAYEVRVPGALSTYFGYDPGVSYKKRSEVATQKEWDDLVKAEIDAGRPVLYCGQDVTAGHAFVCDGYEGDKLHFNWGWGGSANGYFLSTALNPVVSRQHSYNNLNTIIYNIKPATGTVTSWSPIHITADGNQAGMGANFTDLASGETFKVRVGNLKNVTHDDFAGKIAVALCDENGKMKALLSNPANFTMQSMGYLFDGYKDFDGCKLPSGTSVAAGDRVRIVTQANGQTEWLPVAGELLTINELSPNGVGKSFNINFPASQTGFTVEGPASVIPGWDYSFRVVASNPAEDVLTVKANGVSLIASGNNYSIKNVREDQTISILVQKAADVKEKRSIWVGTPGTLSSIIPDSETGTIKDLTLFGTIDARDFTFMKNSMNLTRLDISGVNITANGNDQANAIPREAFRGKGSLKEVILPSSVNRLNNGCFRQCGITAISIPANVNKYEYNVFCGASALRDIYVGRTTAEFINWCVLSGVRVGEVTLHVPNQAAVNNYSKAENWKDIANIIVDSPVASNDVLFAVMENNEVKFETTSDTGSLEKGSVVSFKAAHIADNDNKMEVYANYNRLYPNAEGTYNVTLDKNTIIHFDLIAPISIDPNSSKWTLTGKNGSVGMFSEAVNVIPGQEFSIRLNALNIPVGYDQAYWSAALTDKSGNIKEFISPVNVWSAGPGDSHKLTVNCKVSESNVREGNQIRLVTSFNKKNWNIVKGANAEIVDALSALNNMTPIYTMRFPEKLENATISGVGSSAVRGQDLTLKVVPTSSVLAVDLLINGKEVLMRQPAIEYDFVAMEDMDFDIKVYNPRVGTTKVFNTYPGGLHYQLTEDNVAEVVKVTGEAYSDDLRAATGKDFAVETIKTLDLSELTIVPRTENGAVKDAANELKHVLFSSPTGKIAVVENIILPDAVKRIYVASGPGVFSNCKNIEEITLPTDCNSGPFTVEYSKVEQYFLGTNVFVGCDNLKIIRIPGAPKEYNGKICVAHFRPGGSVYPDRLDWYELGHPDAKKVTIIVPEEYLELYKKADANEATGNPWVAYGYNILSEKPEYGVEFDPTRVRLANEEMNPAAIASFLGDNVPVQTISAEGKLFPIDNGAKATVYVDGEKVELAQDGSIPVMFHNPKFNAEEAGSHRIDVEYTLDLNFAATSDLFAISEPEVTNGEEEVAATHTFDRTDALNPVLRDVKENSNVRFKVDFSVAEATGVLPRVILDNNELIADADGYYEVNLSGGNKLVEIFAVPTEGAVINSEDLAAIKHEECHGITSISLEGELTADDFANVKDCFPNLENLDLSTLEGEIPEGAFKEMENLTTVVLPEVSEIGANMFNGCVSLQSVDIPATVGSIGEGAFKGCASLEKVTLTGVSSIGNGAFEGCDNLTTITLLASSADPKSDARRKAQKKSSSLSPQAFKGVNPNCIIVLDQGVEMPSASANYLLTSTGIITETGVDGNEIEREGRVYSASGDINFIQGYPLAIPHTFTLTDGAVVSLEAETNDWTATVVPFDVETISDSSNNEMTVSLAEDGAEYASGNLIYTLPEGGEVLQSVESMKANVPYFVRTDNNGKIIFAASAVKVPATPAEIKVDGKDYSIHATYSALTLPVEGTYLLDSTASAFRPAEVDEEEGEEVNVAPFSIYATAPVALGDIVTSLPDTEYIPTGVDEAEMVIKDFKVVKEGNAMVVYSPENCIETIYKADGSVVRTIRINAGRNVIELPSAGVYIIRDCKMVF